jgi:hypothetical protein
MAVKRTNVARSPNSCVTQVNKGKKRGEGHPVTCHESTVGGGVDLQLYTLFKLGARWGWSTPRPGRFTPGNEPVPIV